MSDTHSHSDQPAEPRREGETPAAAGPLPARPVKGETDATLPKAIAVPPRDAVGQAAGEAAGASAGGKPQAAGRWKVDETMAPVVENAQGPMPNAQTSSLTPRASSLTPQASSFTPHTGVRRMRGLLVPLVVCVVGLVATIVVAVLTRPSESGGDASAQRAGGKDGEAAPVEPAQPPEPPPSPGELIAALGQGEHHRVKHFLDRKADPNATVDGKTPLLVAVGRGDAFSVRLLLAAGAGANRAGDDGNTPLLAAVERLDEDAINALVDGGADVNLAGRTQTPLMLAARKGSLPLVRLLLERKADPNAKAPAGDTALMVAASYGREEIVAALVEAGADVNDADARGMTPLMFALDLGRPAIVRMLLDNGADPLARRDDGDSALSIALLKNQWPNYRTLDAAAGEAKPRLPGDGGPVPWKYLSELSPSEPPVAARAPDAPPTVKMIDAPHAVWLAPPEDKKSSRAVYTLDRQFRFFQGFVALADSATLKGEQTVTFRIVADGKELWKSAELTRAGDHRNFRVDVGEVLKLELFVDCKTEAAGADAVWVEPKLMN